jgi:hypothetical protein
VPWFKIDDSAHGHPKWVKAGNAALGLFVRCGSYSAQHLTEGIVSVEIARLYGTAPQAAKLVKVGLWHEPGHSCDRCPQPADGEYVIHDFFEGGRNTTRAQAQAAKEAATERQRKRRARQNGEVFDDESSAKTIRNEDENAANRARKDPPFQTSTAGQNGLSQRDSTDGVTPPQAFYQASTSFGGTEEEGKPERAHARGPAEPIPEWALPLVHAVHAAGLPGLRWNLAGPDWFVIHSLIKSKGVAAMADHAVRSAQSSTKPVVSARYFIGGWKDITDAPPAGTGPPALRAISGPVDRRQQATNDLFDRAMERARARDAMESGQ